MVFQDVANKRESPEVVSLEDESKDLNFKMLPLEEDVFCAVDYYEKEEVIGDKEDEIKDEIPLVQIEDSALSMANFGSDSGRDKPKEEEGEPKYDEEQTAQTNYKAEEDQICKMIASYPKKNITIVTLKNKGNEEDGHDCLECQLCSQNKNGNSSKALKKKVKEQRHKKERKISTKPTKVAKIEKLQKTKDTNQITKYLKRPEDTYIDRNRILRVSIYRLATLEFMAKNRIFHAVLENTNMVPAFQTFCHICQKGFHTKNYVKNHIKQVHMNLRQFRCEHNCTFVSKTKSGLNRHVSHVHLKVKNCICPICKKAFTGKSSLKQHVIGVHADEASKRYKCYVCAKAFHFPASMRKHILLVHEHRDFRNFKCDLCDKTFKWKTHLITHIQQFHLNKRHRCKVCDKEFGTSTAANTHMKNVHSNIRKFACKCGMMFKALHTLKVHIACKHNDVRPFACTKCDQRFKLSSHLQQHKRLVHLEGDVKPCTKCHRTFATFAAMKNHMQDFHDKLLNSDLQCPVCEKQFLVRGYLNKHLISIHGRKIIGAK